MVPTTDANALPIRINTSSGVKALKKTSAWSTKTAMPTGRYGVAATAYYYISDISFKENVNPIKDALGKVSQMNGVSFDWKATGEPSIGLIAQEVEKVFPELVSTDDQGFKSIDYGRLTAPLIEAVKQQQEQIDELKAEIAELKNQK